MNQNLSQGIIRTLYLTFSHNELVIAYVVGLAISALMAFKRPSRFYLLLLLGFAILAFNFEYDKHIIDALREQTLTSIVTDPGKHFKAQRLINLFITELMPVIFYIAGWGCIFMAIISQGLKKDLKK